MKLYLIRHGQTDWNACKKIQGSLDIPLNAAGKEQAGLLAKAMEDRPVRFICSSPLKRALHTANGIGERQGVKVVTVPELREVEFGKWEGMSGSELLKEYPKAYKSWRQNPAKVTPPGGETWEEAAERAAMALKKVLGIAQGNGDTAIVSHGATLAHLIAVMMGNAAGEPGLIVSNVSITTVEYRPHTGRFEMIGLNDTAHLK